LNPDRVIELLGHRVAELRVEKGLTQAELAERLGATTPQRVARIEAGANLTVYSLVVLANALGVELESLLTAPRTVAPRRRGRPRSAS